MHFRLLALLISSFAFAEELPVIYVSDDEGKTSTDISAQTVNKTQLDNSISGNGFLGSVIDINANIEVTDISKNSKTAGEIKPGQISINGASPYQNNFMIDGISNNSLIDPANSSPFKVNDVPGNESNMFLDIDLIEEIKVFDSGISAEYNGFLGGVIDVKTIRAGGEPTFKASYKMTNNDLTNIHVAKGTEENFESAKSYQNQPKFDKQFYKLNFTTPIGESNGLVIGYNRKTSTIPQAYLDGVKNLYRQNDNFLLKWSHYFDDDSILDFSATYAPYTATYVAQLQKDSDIKVKGGGYSTNLNYETSTNFFDNTTVLSYSESENSKDSKKDITRKWIRSKDKDWGRIKELDDESKKTTDYSIEGGHGDIDKKQQSYSLSSKFTFKPIDYIFEHTLKTGIEVQHSSSSYIRNKTTYSYREPINEPLIRCNGEEVGCVENQQFLSQRDVYIKADTYAGITSSSFYFEDVIKNKNFELSAGINISYDDYLQNANFSPRFNSLVEVYQGTTLFGGWNRYHGKSFLGYKLRESRVPYYTEKRNKVQNSLSDWYLDSTKGDKQYVFSNLDTPFTDETSIGLRQDIWNNRFLLKYVNRSSDNLFATHKGEPEVFTRADGVTKGYFDPVRITNDGISRNEITSLDISSIEPYTNRYFGFGYKLSTAWRSLQKNADNYNDDPNTETNSINIAYYDGNFYELGDLPFNEDKQVFNLHSNIHFREIDLLTIPTVFRFNSILRYTSAFSEMVKMQDESETYKQTYPDGSTQEYEVKVYRKVNYDPTTTLDLRFDMEMMFGKNRLQFNTEITNVFDTIVRSDSTTTSYEVGRQFWFEIAYKY